MWGKRLQAENWQCKGPEAETHLGMFENNKERNELREEWQERRSRK